MTEISYHIYDPAKLREIFLSLQNSPGNAGAVEPTRVVLGNTANAYAESDDNVRRILRVLGVDWRGTAADAAAQTLHRAADSGGALGGAGDTGSGAVGGYGRSFDQMRATVHWEDPGSWDWIDMGVDAVGIGAYQVFGDTFDIQSDFMSTMQENRTLGVQAVAALQAHEQNTRDAVAAFPVLEPAAALTTGAPSAGDGAGFGTASPHVSGGSAVGPAAVAGVIPVGGSAMSPDSRRSTPGGSGSAASPVAPQFTPPGPGGAVVPSGGAGRTALPGGGGDVRPGVPGPTTPGAGARPVLPGAGVGGTGGAGGGFSPSRTPGLRLDPPGSASGSATPPGGYGYSRGAIPGTTTGPRSPVGAGGPGRGVSSGGEFGSRLPSRAPEGVGRQVGITPATGTGPGRSGATATGTPMMGGMGGGAGPGSTERKRKYWIPSSDAFDVPLPPHTDPVIEGWDE